jgi:hypothetical protein
MPFRTILIAVFALNALLTACHESETPTRSYTPQEEPDQSNTRNWIYENRAIGDIQQAIQVANTMQDLWNATKDILSARERLDKVDKHLASAKDNLNRINDASCGYDLMKDIHANLTKMSQKFRVFLTTADTKDLVNANEALFAARTSIERYNDQCVN